MRAILSAALACVLLVPGQVALAAQAHPDQAVPTQREAAGDRAGDRWQGRQHYLYDDEHQPNSATVGSRPNAAHCTDEFVRLKRSDGTTVVRRLDRCR